MTLRPAWSGALEPSFDAAWLARLEYTDTSVVADLRCHRAFDPLTRTWWFVKTALLAATGAVGQLQSEFRFVRFMHPSWAVVPKAAIWTADSIAVVYPDQASSRTASTFVDPLLPVAQLLDLAIGCAWAVGQAHAQGLLHGDIRLQNMLVDDEQRVRLTGFEYAALINLPKSPAPRPGPLAQPYLAPECWRAPTCGVSVKATSMHLAYPFMRSCARRCRSRPTRRRRGSTLTPPSSRSHRAPVVRTCRNA